MSSQHTHCPYCLRQLSEQVVAFPPETAERRLSTFLRLSPSTSESHPTTQQRMRQSSLASETAIVDVPKQAEATTPPSAEEVVRQRRSSSLSSDSSKNRFRFLKLGPVHWGEHPTDHKGDFHEVDEMAVEE